MVLPQAFLLGDVARLRFSALEENASSTKTKAGTEEDGHNLHGEPAAFEKGIGYILDRSFGKVTAVEVRAICGGARVGRGASSCNAATG